MLFGFYILLILRVGQCTDDQIFVTQTVHLGEDVTLKCPRQLSGTLLWIKFVSENVPQVLTTTNYLGDGDPRITAVKEPGKYFLNITKAKLSDTAVYCCMKIHQGRLIFLEGTNLKVGGPGPYTDITAVPPSDPVHPGDSVTLECSVLAVNNTCLEEHNVFSARLDKYIPSFIYTQGNSGDRHEKSLDPQSLQKCVYNFSRINVNTSDAGGIYYCAVTTCGQILSQNGTKCNTEVSAVNTGDLQKNNTILFLLCAALIMCCIVIVLLLYSIKKIKKKSCDCCNVALVLHTNAAASGVQQSQQTDEDSLVYSVPTFIRKKSSKSRTRDTETAETESIYTAVSTHGLN